MKKLLLALTLTLPLNVFAAGFTGNTKVTRIAAHDYNDVVLVYLENTSVTSNQYCPTNGIVALQRSRANFKEMYDMALLAYVLQKPLWGWMHNCHRPTTMGMPYAIRLDLFR